MIKLDFKELAYRLLSRSEEVCRYLLPNGVRSGHEWVCGDLSGARGKSTSINLNNGEWGDFSEHVTGSDLIALWAAVRGQSMETAWYLSDSWYRSGFERMPDLEERPSQSVHRRVGEMSFRPVPEAGGTGQSLGSDEFWWMSVEAGKNARKWQYFSVDGELVIEVFRFTHPGTGEKAIRPWNPKTNKWEWPQLPKGELRPLLYEAEIRAAPASAPIVWTEGEKAADAVREIGWLATTCAGGSNAIQMSDLSSLAGRRVIVWRDKDLAGRQQTRKLLDLLKTIEVASATVIDLPAEAPVGWDAADTPPENRASILQEGLLKRPAILGRPVLSILEWQATRFVGEPPARKMLVAGVFPMGAVSMVAGFGGIGKGMMLLDLARKVAIPQTGGRSFTTDAMADAYAFGGRIEEHGASVIIGGEDSFDEYHIRLHTIDETDKWRSNGSRLFIVPLPNAGGNLSLVKASSQGPLITDEFYKLRDELAQIKDLKLLILDPIARFARASIERDVDAGQMLLGALGALAAELGISIVISHHMSKARGKREERVMDLQGAREAVRGTTGLVDGPRAVWAAWPEWDEKKAKAIIEAAKLPIERAQGTIVYGGVVKANGPSAAGHATFARLEGGRIIQVDPTLLREIEAAARPQRSEREAAKKVDADRASNESPMPKKDNAIEVSLQKIIGQSIRAFAAIGMPITMTGENGIVNMCEMHFPTAVRHIPGKQVRIFVTNLIRDGSIVKAKRGKGNIQPNGAALDVPDGKFANGKGIVFASANLQVLEWDGNEITVKVPITGKNDITNTIEEMNKMIKEYPSITFKDEVSGAEEVGKGRGNGSSGVGSDGVGSSDEEIERRIDDHSDWQSEATAIGLHGEGEDDQLETSQPEADGMDQED